MYNHGKEKRNTIHFQIIIFLCVPTHIHTLSVVSFHLVVPVMLGRWGNPEMSPYFLSLPLDYKFNLLQCSHCPVGLDSIFPGMPASVCHINLLYCVNRIQVPVGSVYWLGPGQYLCATYYYSLGAARALTFVLWPVHDYKGGWAFLPRNLFKSNKSNYCPGSGDIIFYIIRKTDARVRIRNSNTSQSQEGKWMNGGVSRPEPVGHGGHCDDWLNVSTPWTIQSMEFSRPEYWSG